MFTQLVMLSTIILLALIGNEAFQRSKKINYPPGKILSFGLFLVALGIFCYAIRDIFIQFEIYKIQIIFLKGGGFIHVLGCVLLVWFLSKEFTPERLRRFFFLISTLIIISVPILLTIFPWSSEIIQAPLEPFPYKVVRNFLEPGVAIGGGMFLIITTSILLITIVLYNTFKLEDKKLRRKGLLYGIVFLLLILPIPICSFISPIYARWGYLIGAILLYKTFKMEV